MFIIIIDNVIQEGRPLLGSEREQLEKQVA